MKDNAPTLVGKHKPREGEPDPEEQLDEIGMALTSDVLGAEELEQFPDIKSMSERNQGVFAMHVCGYGPAFMAKAFGVSQPCITRLLNRLDPDRRYKLDPNAKKAFLTRVLTSKAAEAMACITPDKLMDASAKELTGVMKDCLGMSETLNQSKHAQLSTGRLDNLLDEIEREALAKIPEASVEEK